MKNILSLLIISILLLSCTQTDKSMFNTTCTDSCTVVQGRFITGNNEGIANVPIEIKSEIRPTLGLGQTTIRRIASGKTDNNGFYSLKFGLQKREYGQMAAANVSIYFTYDKARFVPVRWYEDFGSQESLGPFARKDTTINANIFLTTRSKLKVRLENFIPIQAGDNFSVITSCAAGLERLRSSEGFLEASQAVTEKEIDACGNEQTTLYIRKRKNGVTSSASATISTPIGQTISVTYAY
jgi:hypothetical protein